ncbi:hypothetical protein K488DRAFT_92093 [Vararia minispora EC-137]|uniref:Uncharacterized protein n=1 Tax=Vararia minispora EC-137 TaxID=1314806 RepID=A0ACB8Q4I9_9AGAM|nr:hypothetical protein K488DRAFT_92093 [Vararia minispora EC-137]
MSSTPPMPTATPNPVLLATQQEALALLVAYPDPTPLLVFLALALFPVTTVSPTSPSQAAPHDLIAPVLCYAAQGVTPVWECYAHFLDVSGFSRTPPTAELVQWQVADLKAQLGRTRELLAPGVLATVRAARSAALALAVSHVDLVLEDAQAMATLVDMDDWHAAHAVAPADPSPSPGPIDIDLWDVSDDILSAPFPLPTPTTLPTSAPAPPSEDAIMAKPEPAAKTPPAVPPLATPSVIAASSMPMLLPATLSSEVPHMSLPPVASVPSLAPASVVGTPIPCLVPALPPTASGAMVSMSDVVERVAVEALLAPSHATLPAPQQGMLPLPAPHTPSHPRSHPVVVVPRWTPSQSASQATPSPVPATLDTSTAIAALFNADAESEAGPAPQSDEGESEIDQLLDSDDTPSPAEIVVSHIGGPPAVGHRLRSAIHNLGLHLKLLPFMATTPLVP